MDKFTKLGDDDMQNYGSVLKRLIKFTNVKLSVVADAAGYDVSYISKPRGSLLQSIKTLQKFLPMR